MDFEQSHVDLEHSHVDMKQSHVDLEHSQPQNPPPLHQKNPVEATLLYIGVKTKLTIFGEN